MIILSVDERSSDSYMGRDDFLKKIFRKSHELCSDSNLIFRSLNLSFFLVQFISSVKSKANSNIENQKCKGHEKMIDF